MILHVCLLLTPAGSTASCVSVLEIGEAHCFVNGQVRRESNALHTFFAFLCSDKDDAIGCLRTVECGSGSTFQDTHAFNIIGIEVGDTVA